LTTIPDRQRSARRRAWRVGFITALCAALAVDGADARPGPDRPKAKARTDSGAGTAAAAPAPGSGPSPELRLIRIYQLIGASQTREALEQAETLVRDAPNFRLAHLVYADLLTARREPLASFGAGAARVGNAGANGSAMAQVEPLRMEAQLRLQALREAPPPGSVPRQFVALPATTRHAIAVDASRSRLYLLEHRANGFELVASYYVSLGRLGVDKRAEGDQRTPLGVYFVTSKLDGHRLTDFYGAGALPLNYPNEYDRREGRTGGGIWLHGVSRDSYAREPRATDGCVVLANEDLQLLLRGVEARRTPVVIAPKLDWVAPGQLEAQRRDVMDLLSAWRSARAAADTSTLERFYLPDANKGLVPVVAKLRGARKPVAAKTVAEAEIKELSVLSWNDGRDVLVVTFGEVPAGARTGHMVRQYWAREGSEWKILFEGVIG